MQMVVLVISMSVQTCMIQLLLSKILGQRITCMAQLVVESVLDLWVRTAEVEERAARTIPTEAVVEVSLLIAALGTAVVVVVVVAAVVVMAHTAEMGTHQPQQLVVQVQEKSTVMERAVVHR